jgi:hypothetical protein
MIRIVCCLAVFGFSGHQFESTAGLFDSNLQTLPRVKAFIVCKPAAQRARFAELWELSVRAVAADLSPSDLPSLFAKLIESDLEILVEAMNFFMSTCEFTKPLVAAGVAIFSGEVLRQLPEFSQLFLTSLISFAQLFDPLTCICSLNEITGLLVKSQTFPEQYHSRMAQVLFKRSSLEDPEVLDFVSLCAAQFCRSSPSGLSDKLRETLSEIVMELFKQNHFLGPGSVLVFLDVLKEKFPDAFNYKLLYQLVGFHFDENVAQKVTKSEVDLANEANLETARSILNLFLASSKPWMVCAAIRFIREAAQGLLAHFRDQIIALLQHENGDIVCEAETVILLVFEAK